MDVRLINPFIDATLNVLETMAQVTSEPGKPYLKTNDIAKGEVTGLIGLSGDINVSISVSFDRGSILKIVSNMLGEEMTEVNADISDAVGELTNMISGQARKGLEVIGTTYMAVIPTVISGKTHKINHSVNGPKIAIPFKTETGEFTIEVCLENAK